jgi:hypothetical protein
MTKSVKKIGTFDEKLKLWVFRSCDIKDLDEVAA